MTEIIEASKDEMAARLKQPRGPNFATWAGRFYAHIKWLSARSGISDEIIERDLKKFDEEIGAQ